MHYIKLVKLLYLLDREALLRWGRPVTTDRYASMPKGPVVSQILNLIREEPEPGEGLFWQRYISRPDGYEVELLEQPPDDELSRSESDLIQEIFTRYGRLDRWTLVRLTHDLPEWKDPEGSSLPIEYRDILHAGQKTPEEIEAIMAEIQNLAAAQQLLLSA